MRIEDYIVPLVSAVSGGFGGWLFGRKRQNAETEVVEGSALSAMQETYRSMVADTNERLLEQNERIDNLEQDLQECKSINAEKTKELFLKNYASDLFGLLIIDYDGVIEYTNLTFDRYYKVKNNYFIGKNYADFLTKEELSRVEKELESAQSTGEVFNFKSKWIVEGKKFNCVWVKTFNDNFGRTTYAVLKV